MAFNIITGTITANAQTIVIDTMDAGSVTIQIDGVGVATVVFEQTDNGVTWWPLPAIDLTFFPGATYYTDNTSSTTSLWQANCSAINQVRVRSTAYTSGTLNVNLECSSGSARDVAFQPNSLVGQGTAGANSNAWPTRLVTPANTLASFTGTSLNVNISGSTNLTISNLPTVVDTNYGTVGASTIRTAAEIGNATGAANFNYGTVGAQTIRTASQIGNLTGAADFGTGTTTAQTLRVTANQGSAGASAWPVSGTVTVSNFPATLDTNFGTVGASTLRVAAELGNQFGLIDFNYGTVGAQTIRTASQIGNATGAALFGAGTTTAQVLRVVLPTDQTSIPVAATLSAETTKVIGTVNQGTSPWVISGTVTANQGTSPWVISGAVTLPYDTNYGTVGATTLRTAAQIGNSTGAANFNAGATGAQTLRVAANLYDSSGTGLTTTSGNLNVNINQATATPFSIVGTKTNNNAPPGATNVGVFPALANAAAPSWTEGNLVALSVDLAGNTRVIDIADGPVAAGTAATKSTLIGGQFNTTLPTLTNTQQAAVQMDASGRIIVTNVPQAGIVQTYSASGLVTAAASATDIFSITGSATKTIMITNFVISGIATAATVATVIILKRSTADTVGTPTTLTNVPNDSADAAGTAVCTTYAGVPTTGTLVGNMKTFKVFLPPPSGGNANSPSFPISFPGTFSQPITLRGAAQTLAINLGGVTIAGAIFAVSVEWIEF